MLFDFLLWSFAWLVFSLLLVTATLTAGWLEGGAPYGGGTPYCGGGAPYG